MYIYHLLLLARGVLYEQIDRKVKVIEINGTDNKRRDVWRTIFHNYKQPHHPRENPRVSSSPSPSLSLSESYFTIYRSWNRVLESEQRIVSFWERERESAQMYSLIVKPSSFASQSSSSSSSSSLPLLPWNRSQLYSSIRFPRKTKSRGRFVLRAESHESPPTNSSNASDSKPPNGSYVSIRACGFQFSSPWLFALFVGSGMMVTGNLYTML